MSPVILKYIHIKVKLFEKHILAPIFSNYEMRLVFGEDGKSCQLEGLIYPKQLDAANQTIARSPQISYNPAVINEVLKQVEILPTTTLDWRVLSENYKVDEIRAKQIVQLARQHQIGENLCPPSLLDLWTPSGMTPSMEEQMLEAQIMQLLQDIDTNEEGLVNTILIIAGKLVNDGLCEELVAEIVDREILIDMNRRLVEMYPNRPRTEVNLLMWYHTLLLKTAGGNRWTLRRGLEECAVEPYHPLLLEALKCHIHFRVSTTSEYLMPNYVDVGAMGSDSGAWTEVPILEFLHGLSQAHFKEPTSQTIIPIMACQTRERCFKEATEDDEERDQIFFNTKNEGFIIINGDLRKMYAMRPVGLQEMTFAQFATSYYRLRNDRNCLLQPGSDVGFESDEQVVGGTTKAPLFLKLSNGVNMKKRVNCPRPVPLLLFSMSLGLYEERMLFKAWRDIENVAEEGSEEDFALQVQNRLALFPMSVFPVENP